MIYILNACQSIFSLPGMACSACGEACKSCPGACQAICGPIRGCLTGCGGSFKQFTERPLSTYVVVSMLVSAGSIYLSMEARRGNLIGVKLPKNATLPAGGDDGEACTSTFLYIVMGFAVINVVFAWFLQNQVWKEIMSHKDEDVFIDGDKPGEAFKGRMPAAATGAMGMLDKARGGKAAPLAAATPQEAPPSAPGKIIIPKNITQDAFKKVFMEDFVVLFMFIALTAMFVLSWKGQDKVDDLKDPNVCKVGNAQYCGYAYFWTAVLYSLAYYCCACCSASVTMAKPTSEEESLE